MSHTSGPWVMKPGDADIREGWSIEAPNAPHPLGSEYIREDNVVGNCCSAGVYREEDALLICAAPDLFSAAKAMLPFIREYGMKGETDYERAVLALEAAIAKAESPTNGSVKGDK